MGKLFGTDGARGVANTELTSEIAYHLGQAAVHFLGGTVALGRDTRLSGDMLSNALSAGVMSAGGTVLDLGIIPTPGVALLTRQMHASCGIVISASHNPPEYNGIKFFDAEGYKLPVSLEDSIEAFVLAGGLGASEKPGGDAVGTITAVDSAVEMYIAHAVNMVKDAGMDFKGWKIALDTGHGASSLTTAHALEQLGADVTVINDDFNGVDINVECGSTHLGPLKELVAQTGAMLGIAHDGDADRVLFVDAEGNEIDGDMVEAVCGVALKQAGQLPSNTVVSTVMCNLGFVHAMRDNGIAVQQTSVGDRFVLECMRDNGYAIGGEQSGHTIFLQHNSTGDGLITACQFIMACITAGKTPAQAAAVMTRFPQELINVRVKDKNAWETNAQVQQAIKQASDVLGENGRVLVRTSGTEPLIRVMVEAADDAAALEHAQAIAKVVEDQLA